MPHPLAPQLLDAGDPNALADGVWPAGAERVDGAVRIGGADLREVAQAHGTPFLLVDEAVARGRARRIREAFEAAFDQQGVDVYYAGKALLTADVARWMRAEGLRIDVCTGGELAIAGGSAVVGQKLLETIFGEDAVRRLAAQARDDLDTRVRALMGAEAARWDALLTPVEQGASGDVLRDAAAELEAAMRAVATAPDAAGSDTARSDAARSDAAGSDSASPVARSRALLPSEVVEGEALDDAAPDAEAPLDGEADDVRELERGMPRERDAGHDR